MSVTERIDLQKTVEPETTIDRDYAFLAGFGFSGMDSKNKEGSVKSSVQIPTPQIISDPSESKIITEPTPIKQEETKVKLAD
jgi:hypothetical protein